MYDKYEKEYHDLWVKNNLEHHKEYQRQWREKNKEKMRIYQLIYRIKNRDRLKDYAHKYYHCELENFDYKNNQRN